MKLNHTAQIVATVLSEAFSELKSCEAIWSIRAEAHTSDWKRNAGATTLNERDRIRLQIARPNCMRGNVAFPALKLGNAELFFLPDSILISSKNSVAALHYRDLYFSNTATTFIESGRVPRDAAVIGQTWRFVNKHGGPDRRFNFNRQLPLCRYGEMDFSSSGGLNGKMQYSNISSGEKFSAAIKILLKNAASSSELNPISSYSDAKNWPSIVFLSCALVIGAAIVCAGVLIGPSTSAGASNVQVQPGNGNFDAANKGSALNSSGATQARQRKMQSSASTATAPLDISPVLSEPAPAFPPTQAFGLVPSQRTHEPLTNKR